MDASVYENSTGKNGTITTDVPVTYLLNTGKYSIHSKLRDDPTKGNAALDDYRKWSNESQWTDGLYVHSLPEASVSSEIQSTDDPNKFICKLTFDAFDTDCLSHDNKGIADEKYEWKRVDDNSWQEGTVPEFITAEEVYLQKYTVCDEQGYWSRPVVEIICAQKQENTEHFTDNEDPSVTITVSDKNPCYGDKIIISASAQDDTGIGTFVLKVNGRMLSVRQGSCIYECNSNGELLITAECTDLSGKPGYAEETVTVTEETVNQSGQNTKKEKNTPEKREDIPADITIEASADIAEVGDYINVSVNAEDQDGLTSMAVYKDGRKIADGPCEFRFCEAEAKVVEIKVTTKDACGYTSQKTKEIIIEDHRDKLPPEAVISYPVEGDTVSGKISVTGTASDETSLREYVLEYKSSSDSFYTTIVSSMNKITDDVLGEWNTNNLNNGQYILHLTAVDNGGNRSESTVNFTVKNGSEVDENNLPDSLIEITRPEKGISADTVLKVEATTDISLAGHDYSVVIRKNGSATDALSKESKVSNAGTSGKIDMSFDTSMLDGGDYTVEIAIADNEGKIVSKTVSAVIDHGLSVASEENSCSITSPADLDELKGISEISGTAPADMFTKYKFEYSLSGDNDYVIFGKGDITESGTFSNKFDTTVLKNGYYDIRLTVSGNEYVSQDEITVNLTGNLKIGNFTLSFTDINFDVNGVPVSVVRTYDSRTRNQKGSFGYGWDMTASSARVSLSTSPAKGWEQQTTSSSFITTYEIKETKRHRVSVDLGNGIRDEFAMTLSPQKSVFVPVQYDVSVGYQALNGSKSKLEPCNTSTGGLIFLTDTLYTDNLELYEPQQYMYTRSDGTKYLLDINKGLLQVTAANGEVVRFEDDGIKCSDNKSVLFTYDNNGNITGIEAYNGKKISYEYDVHGDLVSVTDEAGNVTKFVYQNHYITETYDPRGILVSKNVYDDNGRLVKTIDSAGNEMLYDHDIDGRQEIITDRNGNQTVYTYDERGNVTSETDPNGNTVKYEYDSNGNKTKKTDAAGNTTEYTYDDSGLITSMTDPEGCKVTNAYDSKGMITSVNAMGTDIIRFEYNDMGLTSSTTDALGNDIDYNYDSKGRLNSVTDSIGTYMNMTYDSRGNVISATNGAGSVSEFTYDENDNCISRTITYTSEGVQKVYTENYTYDAAGNAVKVVDSDGNVISKEYNSIGKVILETDSKNRQTAYAYDNFGNVTKITYPDRTSESFTYDAEGNNLTATDRLGRTVTMEYDKVGNLTAKTYSNGLKEEYTYDVNYNVTSVKDVTGTVTKYEYDRAGKNTAITDGLGNRVTFGYDSHAQLESMTDAKGKTTRYSYDANGNRTGVTYSDGSSSSAAYDARGRVTSQTDQNGNVTQYTYDGADRLTGVTDALGNHTAYSYDETGNLISVTDAENRTTSYVYDAAGRVVKATNAAGQSEFMTYDSSGNILTSSDFGGKTTKYEYDNNDRMLRKITDEQTYSYSYTSDGKLASVSDRSGRTTFTYDGMDGLTKVSYPDGKYVEYIYDGYLRLSEIITPYGSEYYSYDALNRLERVVDRNGYATVYSYDANGNRSKVQYANGITVTYKYDVLNRLTEEISLDSEGNCVASYKYSLGNAGERIKAEELDRTVEYTYDALYRLTGEKITDSEGQITEYTYEYDRVSNRTVKTENGERTDYTYNVLNQLVSENAITYDYDDAGNLIQKTDGEKVSLFAYDAENRMIRATVQEENSVSVEEYKYDYAGNRTAKITETDTVYYLNDIGSGLTQVIAETDASGNLKCLYTRGSELISQERDGVVSTYLMDGHGSVRQLADGEGHVTDTYVYDAWGNMISSEGETANSYLYCGEQFDNSTGLYYLRARYMDPSTGIFTTMDTYQGSLFDPVTLHKYLYANANPVSNTDPSGKFSLGEVGTTLAIDAIIGGISCGLVSGILGAISQSRQEGANSFGNIFNSFLSNFGKGFLKGAVFGVILGGLGILGETWLIANVILIAINIGFSMKELIKSLEAFTLDDDPLLGWIHLGLAFLGVLGIRQGVKNYSNIKASQKAVTSSSDMVTVTRWGRPGLKSGDWVMLGEKSFLNYLFSCKWQPGFTNKPAGYNSAETFEVPGNTLIQPSGSIIEGFIKSLFNQWRYYE